MMTVAQGCAVLGRRERTQRPVARGKGDVQVRKVLWSERVVQDELLVGADPAVECGDIDGGRPWRWRWRRVATLGSNGLRDATTG